MFVDVVTVDDEEYYKERIYINLGQMSYFCPESLELHMISGEVFKLQKQSSERLLNLLEFSKENIY